MADITIKEKVAGIKIILVALEEGVKELQQEGVILTFTIASEKKTVEVSSASIFEISCKATINQEL